MATWIKPCHKVTNADLIVVRVSYAFKLILSNSFFHLYDLVARWGICNARM